MIGVSPDDMIALLVRHGFSEVRNNGGSHKKYSRNGVVCVVTIGQSHISPGEVHKHLKTAGIAFPAGMSRKQFFRKHVDNSMASRV